MAMLRELKKEEYRKTYRLLRKDSDGNHFFLHYMEILDNSSYSIFLFEDTYILYVENILATHSKKDRIPEEALKFISSLKFRMLISPGRNDGIENLVKGNYFRREYLMAFRAGKYQEVETEEHIISTIEEYEEIAGFYDQVDEFRNTYSLSDMQKKFSSRDNKNFISAIKDGGRTVSALVVNSGIISSVGTIKEYRKRGLAGENIKSALSYFFRNNGKKSNIFLLYDDNAMGSYYRSLGFDDITEINVIKRLMSTTCSTGCRHEEETPNA